MELILGQVSLRLAGATLLRPFDLTIAAGEIVTLMGPSGAGKSALLSLIAGDLALPLTGSGLVSLGGRDLAGVAPERRRIGRLFQDDLLFPHLSVGENLRFGMPRGTRSDRLARMRDALASAELVGLEDRAPHTLSGGQKARVALFRALLAEPLAMLLDEPFAKLDMELRQTLRGFVFTHLRQRNIPTLLVSHDRADAPPRGRLFSITRDGELRHD